MSLDGFITRPDDGPENGFGTGGEALHDWLCDGDNRATGAVLPGRTFDTAAGWCGHRNILVDGAWSGEDVCLGHSGHDVVARDPFLSQRTCTTYFDHTTTR